VSSIVLFVFLYFFSAVSAVNTAVSLFLCVLFGFRIIFLYLTSSGSPVRKLIYETDNVTMGINISQSLRTTE